MAINRVARCMRLDVVKVIGGPLFANPNARLEVLACTHNRSSHFKIPEPCSCIGECDIRCTRLCFVADDNNSVPKLLNFNVDAT